MAENEDHVIAPVRADQAMYVLAVAVCNTINSMATKGDENDLKAGQALFSIFVLQLAGFSKEPATMARLLRIVADEMDRQAMEAEKADASGAA